MTLMPRPLPSGTGRAVPPPGDLQMRRSRFGITRDPIEGEQKRKERHSRLSNWRVVTTFGKRSLAESTARFLSERFDCDSEFESGPEHATWYLYRFDY